MKLTKSIFPILCIFLLVITFSCNKNKIIDNLKADNSSYYKALETAENHFKANKIDSAFYYYNFSKTVVKPDSSNNKPIYSLMKMSEIQQIQNDFVGSEISDTEALTLFNNFSTKSYKCGIYNSLGINYQYLYNFEESLKYYKLALNLTDNEIDKISLKNNISVVYMDKLDFKNAILILESLLKNKITIENQLIYARILDNLGFCYFKVKNPKSLNFLLNSMKLKQAIKDDFGLLTSYLHLAEFYKASNKNQELKFAKLALQQSINFNCIDEHLTALEFLIKNQSGNDSRNYALLHINLNDSIKRVRQIAKNQFAKIRYDSKKTTEENFLLKIQKKENDLKIENQNYKIFAVSALGLLILFTSIYFIQFLISRNKNEKLKTEYQTETRISKKLHDELANDVFNAMTFAITQNLGDEAKKESLINSLDNVYIRTRDISKENNNIETNENFKENLKEMLSQYKNQNLNVIINGIDEIKWSLVNESKKIITHRILQELIINVKKHSFATICVISFKYLDKKIQINFNDNGVGMKLGEKFPKNGLQNTVNRIESINGTITFESEPQKGFKVMFNFPE